MSETDIAVSYSNDQTDAIARKYAELIEQDNASRSANVPTVMGRVGGAIREAIDAIKGPSLQELIVEPGRMEAAIRGEGVEILAWMVAEFFRRVGGINFVEVDLTDNSDPSNPLVMRVLIQNALGETPAQMVTIQRKQIQELEKAIAVLANAAYAEALSNYRTYGTAHDKVLDHLYPTIEHNSIAFDAVKAKVKEMLNTGGDK